MVATAGVSTTTIWSNEDDDADGGMGNGRGGKGRTGITREKLSSSSSQSFCCATGSAADRVGGIGNGRGDVSAAGTAGKGMTTVFGVNTGGV